MATARVDIAAITFTAPEKASALAIKTNVEELRAVAIQSIIDAVNALTTLTNLMESTNKSDVDAVIATL